MDFSKKDLKRVLMIFSNSYDGHYARDLAHGFHASEVKLGLISLTGAQKPSWIIQECADDLSSGFKPGASLFSRIFRTILILLRYKPDVIQTHLFTAGIVGLIAGKILKIPVVHTRHHIDEHYQSGTWVHRLIDRTVAKLAAHVVVCSAAAKTWLVEIEGVRASKITVINQGFDFTFLSPTSSEISLAKHDLNLLPETLNIICIARYSPAKGQSFLLEAVQILTKEIPKISVTFVGPGDSSWLERLVINLELQEYVRVLPARNDIPACIRAADIVVHPSLADSFSQLIIEAQAVGGALIATDIAAAREQIIDGVTGIIIPPRDPDSIRAAIIRLVKSPKLLESIQSNGPSHVRTCFSWERMVEEELECLGNYSKKHV